MKKSITAAIAITVLLTGCGSKPSSVPADPTAAATPSAASAGISTAQPAASPSPSASAQASASPSATPGTDAGTGAKTYKMNKNYDIVPIDPSGNKKVVLLTFDDGPKEKTMIEPMLDVLDKHKAKAIFFVNGYRVKAHPELLKLIHDRGGVIGNHSWDHIDLKKESDAKIDQQVDDNNKIIKETVGAAPLFFRPPFGSGNDYLKAKIKQENMLYMTWSDGSTDWLQTSKAENSVKGEAVIKAATETYLHYGANILMHELEWTVEALDRLLTILEQKGYTFVDPNSIDTTMAP